MTDITSLALPAGFILINKPVGPTSHDIIYKLRAITGIKKIGHAGTLDPFASGLLIVAIGRSATRDINQYVKLSKEYEALIYLGKTTDSYDLTGKETSIAPNGFAPLEKKQIKKVLKKFIGRQKQIPPMFSAKKVKGRKLYELARQGQSIEREASEIEIKKLKILKYQWPLLSITVKCSSGTYVRSLAHDIGQELGSGAYLRELKRIAIGKFKLKKAQDLKTLNKNNWPDFLFYAKKQAN